MSRRTAVLLMAISAVLCWPGTSAGARTEPGPARDVVLIGVPGLRWADITQDRSPQLLRLVGRSATGGLSARTIGRFTCPADGWVTISAGARAATGPLCRRPPRLDPSGQGVVVADLPGIRQYNTGLGFPTRLGLLGDAVHRAGRCVTAVGPGAALAAADGAGRVDHYAATVASAERGLWTRCPVTIAALDDLATVRGSRRADVVRGIDTAVGSILARISAGTTVLVAGVGDDRRYARLRVALAAGEGTAGRYLGSASTRRPDLVILPDVTATVLAAIGVPAPDGLVGTPWRPGAEAPGPIATIRHLTGQAAAPEVLRPVGRDFYHWFMIGQLTVYAAAAVALWRRGRSLLLVKPVALAAAAFPVSVFLVNLLPWPQSRHPAEAVLGGIAAFDLLVVGIALCGPWRRHPLGPGSVVAAVSALVLAADQLTGCTLQFNSFMGYSPIGGFRYYGMGNIGFAVLTTSTLLAVCGLAHRLRAKGRPRAALASVVTISLGVAALDGWAGWGSDLGGMIAFIPGLAVTVLLVSGRRVSRVKLGLLGAATTAVVLGVAFLDHLRPPDQRSHLGRFFGDLLAGQGMPVVSRKTTAMLHSFTNPDLTSVAVAALLFLVVVLARPRRAGGSLLRQAFERAPLLRAGLAGALVTVLLGTVVNDSGVSILALGLTVTVPVTVAVCAHVLRSEVAAAGTRPALAGPPLRSARSAGPS
ncbi:hypothetical protein ACRYCC_03680 [Actinomadura scrupuli]|uniref:hypothetical protein n=1 Tax=Actinomadura scrupuli TaxID=559629 RepID=UPI003D9521F1